MYMAGHRSFFTTFEDFNCGIVIFGNKIVTCVKGTRTITLVGCPKLKDVLLLKG